MSRSYPEVAARAIEALAADSDSDSDEDSPRIQLLAEERRVMSLLRNERIFQDHLRVIRSHPSLVEGIPPDLSQRRTGNFCESFLEIMARQECESQKRAFLSRGSDNNDSRVITRVQDLHRLFSKSSFRIDADLSDGENSSGISGSSGDDDESEGDTDLDDDSGNDDDEEENIPQIANDALIGDEVLVNEDSAADLSAGYHGENAHSYNNIASVLQLVTPPSSVTFDSNISGIRGTNNFQRLSALLASLANSDENPLIRADIPWSVIVACGTPFMDHVSNQTNSLLGSASLYISIPKPSLLQTLYHQLDDSHGTRLLQGVLRSKSNRLIACSRLLDCTNA